MAEGGTTTSASRSAEQPGGAALAGGIVITGFLEAHTTTALTELGLDATVEKVTGPAEIASWGVMST